jgi:hypothetical protein
MREAGSALQKSRFCWREGGASEKVFEPNSIKKGVSLLK